MKITRSDLSDPWVPQQRIQTYRVFSFMNWNEINLHHNWCRHHCRLSRCVLHERKLISDSTCRRKCMEMVQRNEVPPKQKHIKRGKWGRSGSWINRWQDWKQVLVWLRLPCHDRTAAAIIHSVDETHFFVKTNEKSTRERRLNYLNGCSCATTHGWHNMCVRNA